MKHISNTKKFGTKSKSSLLFINMIFEVANIDPKSKHFTNMLIMDISFGIDYLDPILQIC